MNRHPSSWLRLRPSTLLVPALASIVALGAAGCCGKSKGAAKKVGEETPTPNVPSAGPATDFAAGSKPLAPTPAAQTVGGAQITAELCPFPEPMVDDGLMDVVRSIAVSGSDLYLADAKEQVRVYSLPASGACKLTPKASVGTNGVLALDPKVKMVSADATGRVFASSGVFGGTMLKDGKPLYKCESRPLGYVQLHRSGKYGVGSFANADVSKVDFTDTGCKSAPWVFTGMSQPTRKGPFTNVNSIGFADDFILVGGVIPKETDKSEPRIVAIMTADGKEKMRIGSTKDGFPEDRHGWIHGSTSCKTGFCVLDSNFKKVTLWKKDGTYVGKLDLPKLTGVSNVWGAALEVDAKGNTYLAVAGQREGGSKAYEGLIFKLTGI